jgi:hypothetical protein
VSDNVSAGSVSSSSRSQFAGIDSSGTLFMNSNKLYLGDNQTSNGNNWLYITKDTDTRTNIFGYNGVSLGSGSGGSKTALMTDNQQNVYCYNQLQVTGAVSLTSSISATTGTFSGAISTTSLSASTASYIKDTYLQDSKLYLRSSGDVHHYVNYNDSGIRLHSYNQGVLGTGNGGDKTALYWNRFQQVGIGGQTSPSYNLDVTGTGRFTSNLIVSGTLQTNQYFYSNQKSWSIGNNAIFNSSSTQASYLGPYQINVSWDTASASHTIAITSLNPYGGLFQGTLRVFASNKGTKSGIMTIDVYSLSSGTIVYWAARTTKNPTLSTFSPSLDDGTSTSSIVISTDSDICLSYSFFGSH